jgi:hypothetical protein
VAYLGFCSHLCTGWSKMYLPRLNSIFSATSDFNLKKLCCRTIVLKPFVFVRFCTEPSSGYSIIEEYFRTSESPEKVRRAFQVTFGVKVGPDRHTISNLVNFARQDQFWTLTLKAAGLQQQGLKPIFKKLESKHTEHIVI